jgi:hypothetical protein
MGAWATPTVRAAKSAVLSAALAMVLALSLGGCGYRELKAPCGPEEGAPPALSYAPVPAIAATGSPLDQMSAGSGAMGAISVADPCGPLRPINGSRAIGGPPP